MKTRAILLSSAVAAAAILVAGFQAAPQMKTSADPVVAGFQKTTESSAADAVDQITGRRGFLSHQMRPRVPGRIVGRAVTAILRETSPDKATPALSAKHSVAMIDSAQPGEVGVIVVENGLDVAGIGGLMATTAKARGLAGVIVDGGARDIGEIRQLGLPLYSSSVIPSSSVGRWASVANNVPVQCAGVMVRPGDIIIAGEDGVTVVPKEKEADVLKRALEIDARESKMLPMIRQYKSLSKVVELFNRI
jgi:4-hydroxy-4-methyl-2-oxoglutarate aldolase